tara:strand:- start:8592 stop:9734 length:1143 start_codon:yes stop_codon:yes gene_type:complete
MRRPHYLDHSYEARLSRKIRQWRWSHCHIDPLLFTGLLALSGLGLFNLYSASNQHLLLVKHQILHYFLAFVVLLSCSQIPPRYFKTAAPWLYCLGLLLLLLVLFVGHTSQGATRWVGYGAVQIQPSEIMKLAMPMMLAWLWQEHERWSPLHKVSLSAIILLVPTLLIAKQPDLGTAILIASAGSFVILLGGLDRKIILFGVLAALITTPILWHTLHDYQKQRIETFLHPEKDPLGTGYNIIQSKIAVGSGGFTGKGWLQGTQSHLSFLPAHTTDFIFSVAAEEWGLIGCCLLLGIYSFIFLRCASMSIQAQSTFTRLLAGSLSLTFMTCACINIGMVIGILPVVGVPLPLVSYGGSSMITTMMAFGIIMSIQTHKKLWSS